MLTAADIQAFDRIYSTDLVFAPDCWKLCGNAHCCNFSRHKSRFTMIGRHHFQELPLLPGEWEYLESKGYARCFADCEHQVTDYELARGRMRIEVLVGRSKNCACEHDTRTTTCRLYPLLPVFDIAGRLVDADPVFGIFEELEQLDGLERACALTSIPFAEVGKFLTIANAIASGPRRLFYVMAYRLTRQHVRQRLVAARAARDASAFSLLEGAFVLRRLFDQTTLRPALNSLADAFHAHYGDTFALD